MILNDNLDTIQVVKERTLSLLWEGCTLVHTIKSGSHHQAAGTALKGEPHNP